MITRQKMHKLLAISIFLAAVIITTEAKQSKEDLEKSGVPDDVVKIVEAINKVQKNVTVNPNNVDNVRVATGNWKKKPVTKTTEKKKIANDKKTEVNPLPFVISPDIKPVIVKKKPRPENTYVEEEEEKLEEDNLVEPEETFNSAAHLDPPSVSIFSYGGIREWFDWVVNMRDPKINPSGTSSSWRSILTTGIFSLARQYNPFRSFYRSGRSMDTDTDTLTTMVAVYNNRDEIVDKLATNEIQPDAQSIMDYAIKLELEKKGIDDLDSSDISKQALQNIQVPTALTTLVNLLNGQNIQLPLAGLNIGNKPVVTKGEASPQEVQFINFLLKWVYVLLRK